MQQVIAIQCVQAGREVVVVGELVRIPVSAVDDCVRHANRVCPIASAVIVQKANWRIELERLRTLVTTLNLTHDETKAGAQVSARRRGRAKTRGNVWAFASGEPG